MVEASMSKVRSCQMTQEPSLPGNGRNREPTVRTWELVLDGKPCQADWFREVSHSIRLRTFAMHSQWKRAILRAHPAVSLPGCQPQHTLWILWRTV